MQIYRSKPYLTTFLILMTLVVVWSKVPDTAHANLSDNLVGEWKLDEGTGTTTADTSGNGNDGIIIREASTSSPAWVSPGHNGSGSALEFDGTGTLGAAANSVNLGDSPTLDGIDNYTMSVWVKFDGPDYVGPGVTWANLIGRNAPSTAWAYMLYVHKSGTVRPHHQSEDVVQYYDSADPIPLGEWVHIEQVADGSNLRLYINGEEDPASPQPYTGSTVSVDNANTYIGQDAREFTPLATISEASIYNAALVAPGGVRDGLTTWQKADDDAATGALWEDFYISTNNATQAIADNQPTFQANGINFNPTLSFDGNDYMDYASDLGISGTNNFSTFLTTEANTYAGTPVVWGHDGANDASPMLFYSAGTLSAGVSGGSGLPTCNASVSTSLPAGVAGIASSIRSNNDTLTLELNGGGTGTGSCSEDFFNYPREIGARASGTQNNLNGLFTEIVHYNRTLSASEEQRVNSYLAIKYGITLDQATPQDYLASDGATTPWNATEGGVYNNDIAGIGRDDKSLLNQKQSKSVNGDALITIGHGSIETTNQANTNDFANDLSFMMWGNNGSSTTTDQTVTNTNLLRMSRIWAVQETGTVGSVKVRLPQSVLPGDSPMLLVSAVRHLMILTNKLPLPQIVPTMKLMLI